MHYVLGFQFDRDGSRVALIKKERPASQRGLWNGIGGKVEPGETPKEAMVREFGEETGVAGQSKMWCEFVSLRTWTDNLVSCFMSFTFQVEEVRTAGDEIVRVFQLPLPGKLELVPNVQWLINMALSLRSGGRGGDGRESARSYVVVELPPEGSKA